MPNPTYNVPANRSPIADRNGIVGRDWYRFFFNIMAQITATNDQVALIGTGPAISVFASAAQGLPDNVHTRIVFDGVQFDTNNNFANSTFTPTVAGYYQINAHVALAAYAIPAGSGETVVAIYRNNVMFSYGMDSISGPTSHITVTTNSDLVYLNGTTDFIDVRLYQKTGATINTQPGANYTRLSAFLARPA